MAEDETTHEDAGSENGHDESLRGRLGKEIVIPIAASAVAAAATYAAKKGPDLVKGLTEKGEGRLQDTAKGGGAGGIAAGAAKNVFKGSGSIVGRLTQGATDQVKKQGEEKGGVAGLAAKMVGKAAGGEGGRGWGKGRRLPLLRSIDIAAPVEEVYERWTDFDEFSKFMHRVEQVEQSEDDSVTWHENIWGRRRTWKTEVTEQKKNERIAWRITGGGRGTGVITFHRLAPRLTRVEVLYDWQPQGLVEKMGSGFRFHKRAAKADLYRFKAYVETGGGDEDAPRAGDDEKLTEPADEAQDNGEDSGGSDDEREQARKEREKRRREREKQLEEASK